MKDLDYYKNLPFSIRIFADEGGYAAKIEELPGCISCGDTKEEALKNIEDAKECWLLAAMEDGISIPEPKKADAFSGNYKIRMPKSLHREIYERSKDEGVSMNQFMIYALQKGMAAK